jgi:hypothetical protein
VRLDNANAACTLDPDLEELLAAVSIVSQCPMTAEYLLTMLNIYIYVCDTSLLSLLQFDGGCQGLQAVDGGDDLMEQLLEYMNVLVSEPS